MLEWRQMESASGQRHISHFAPPLPRLGQHATAAPVDAPAQVCSNGPWIVAFDYSADLQVGKYWPKGQGYASEG